MGTPALQGPTHPEAVRWAHDGEDVLTQILAEEERVEAQPLQPDETIPLLFRQLAKGCQRRRAVVRRLGKIQLELGIIGNGNR
jgi:hypothetical protein